jgi:dolichol-phosphate mannosyltransferase
MSRHLIVLPSYNERENLWNLIEAILAESPSYQVCVVDDNSPDGTAPHIQEQIQIKNLQPRVHLIVRQKKKTVAVEPFEKALDGAYNRLQLSLLILKWIATFLTRRRIFIKGLSF